MKYRKFVVLFSFILFFCGCASTSAQTQHPRPAGFWTNKEAVVQIVHFYSRLATNNNGRPALDATGKFTTKYAVELGTGVVVDVNGLVMTNNHVVANNPLRFSSEMPIVPPELIGTPPQPDIFAICTIATNVPNCRKAEVVATDPVHDLAKLHTGHHFPRAVEFADDSTLVPGDEIYFWGNAFELLPPSPFFGRFLGRLEPPYFTGGGNFSKESLPLLLMDMTLVNGSSGGPGFNGSGKCIGLGEGFYPAVPGPRPVGVTIPSTVVMKFDKENPYPQPKK